MRIHSSSLINHPLDVVYAAYRDEMSRVVPWIPDVREIAVAERIEPSPGVVQLHNIWRADREVPAFARRWIKPEMLEWDDFALWTDAELGCTWELKTRFFSEAVQCTGETRFAAEGAGTRVTLSGDLQIDPRAVPGVPRALAGRVGPQIERFVVSLVAPNLERVNNSLGRYLDQR